VLRVTLDNLDKHKAAPLCEASKPSEARRIARKLEFHYTPKRGPWLNMAGIESSILQRQCLDRRIADEEILLREVGKYEQRRRAEKSTVHQFTRRDHRDGLLVLF
jgi:hypothetical protein